MIHYQSTRGSKYIKTSAQAIIAGIAEDKGLYVPSEIPALPFEIDEMIGKPYKEVAYRIIKAFFEAIKGVLVALGIMKADEAAEG